MAKMIGKDARVCEYRYCTCNEGLSSNRRKDKRSQKRRERRVWKREVSEG